MQQTDNILQVLIMLNSNTSLLPISAPFWCALGEQICFFLFSMLKGMYSDILSHQTLYFGVTWPSIGWNKITRADWGEHSAGNAAKRTGGLYSTFQACRGLAYSGYTSRRCRKARNTICGHARWHAATTHRRWGLVPPKLQKGGRHQCSRFQK